MNKRDYDPDSAEARACISQPAGIHTLAPSPTNPRKTFPEDDMREMTANVKQHGILQPLLVRCWPANYPYSGDMPLFEIVAGERRYRAAKAAGLTLVPVLVRDLSDREVLELQVIENLQRKDLHPLEEAEGYGLMMDKHGYTADELAGKIDKSRSYIFGRLKLLALDDDARRLFRGGLLNPSTALLVARIPSAKLRAKAIREITETDYHGDNMSVRRAQRYIQDRYMLKLADAPFPRGDRALIEKAGRCFDCPKRTGNQPEIFDDVKSADVCTDPDCFQAKKHAHLANEAEKVIAAGGQVIGGKAAEKLAAHGIEPHTTLAGFTQLDKKCHEDPDQRTYREILGEDIVPTMIEDVRRHVLIPVVPNSLLAEKLQAVGLKSREAEHDKEDKKKADALALERAWRDRLLANVRNEVADQTKDGEMQLSAYRQQRLTRIVTQRLFERAGDGDTRRKIISFWQPAGKNYTERCDNLNAAIDNMSTSDCWRLMIDLLIVGGSICNEWSMQYEPKELLNVASLLGIDAAEVKADIQGKAQKSAKPSRKPPGVPVGEAPSPADAAPAEETKRAREEAAPASGTSADESETATPKSETQTPASAGIIEMNEKPTAERRAIAVGARVRIKEGKAADLIGYQGKEGVITEIGESICNGVAILVVQLNDDEEINVTEDEIEVVEKPAKQPPLYQHPEITGLTWSGRGRKPKWVEAWLATNGNTLDGLKPHKRCDKTRDMLQEAA